MTNRDVINALAFGGSGGGGGVKIDVSDPITWTTGEYVPESVMDFWLTHDIINGYAVVTKTDDDEPWALSSVSVVSSGGTDAYRINFRNENFISSSTASHVSQMTVAIETRLIKGASGNLANKTCRCYAAKLI